MIDASTFLTVKDVARLVGIPERQVLNLAVTFYRDGRSRLYARRDLEDAEIIARPPVAEVVVEPEPTSWVYFVASVHLVKIGVAKNPSKRFAALQCGSPSVLRLMGVIPGNSRDEAAYHERWDAERVRGEWFRLTAEIRQFVKSDCRPWPGA